MTRTANCGARAKERGVFERFKQFSRNDARQGARNMLRYSSGFKVPARPLEKGRFREAGESEGGIANRWHQVVCMGRQ